MGLVDHLQRSHPFLHNFPCVLALRETDNWNVTGMEVRGCVCVCFGDSGRTAILCPRHVCQLRCPWECNERCAVMIDSLNVLSVYMPYGG